MQQFTLITGSQHKLREWQRLLADRGELSSQAVDLVEIQSLDSSQIIKHKLHQAYDLIGSPVVVEDVSAGLDNLNGLPGPFIKFFEERLGKGALHRLGGDNAPTTLTCTIGYYDGATEIIAVGMLKGRVVAPQGDSGFGFDVCFIPEGSNKTFAQMTGPEKDALSHRHLAIDNLLAQLTKL